MDPKKILIIAIIIGVIAVVLLQMRASGDEGEKVVIFRATEALGAGDVLAGAYESVERPLSWFAPMQTEVPTLEHESFISSVPLIRDIGAGEIVTFDHLLKTADEGIRAKISPGMRAVSINVSGPQAVGYMVRPGDYVDILGTVATADEDSLVSKYLFQAKKVLATDQQYRLEDSAFPANRSFSSITIEVTPEEAQKVEILRLLVQNGFSLALRSKEDQDLLPAMPQVSVLSPEFDQIGNR